MIEVVNYDSHWPLIFEDLRKLIWPLVEDVAISIEHVGSTAVTGLAAKPIIDIDIVASVENIPVVITRLSSIGYVHEGDLGIPGREAFRNPPDVPPHHLYACVEGCVALQNHLAVRDYLRTHPEAVKSYGEIKRQLAAQFPNDIDAYIAGKSADLSRILSAAGISDENVTFIHQLNINLR